jgi:hypothetical protein
MTLPCRDRFERRNTATMRWRCARRLLADRHLDHLDRLSWAGRRAPCVASNPPVVMRQCSKESAIRPS